MGGLAHRLANQYEMQRLAHPYYNSRAAGGEGHLEVAKNIYYHNKSLSHFVLCLKPFGCMPSTQSDAAQSAVISHFKDMIFLPIETSGEGDVNAHSRVQMALGEAKAKARREFAPRSRRAAAAWRRSSRSSPIIPSSRGRCTACPTRKSESSGVRGRTS